MPEAVIADASCLIVLANIERLELLHAVYGRLFTTPEVAAEFGEDLPPWIELARVKDGGKQQVLQLQIDKGEASAIALAMEMPKSLLILDDLKARHIATRLGLRHTGTLGVVVKAKLNGHIGSIKPVLAAMQAANFRISREVEAAAFRLAGE